MMKQTLIYVYLISLFSFAIAQEKSEIKTTPYKIFVGIDLANPMFQLISQKKGYEASISIPVQNKWHGVVEFGYEKNIFDQTDWDTSISGFFGRLGGNWYVDSDHKNKNNGYYLGGRIGYSPYSMDVKAAPIRNLAGELSKKSLGKIQANAVWFAPVVGARVNLGNTNIYVDTNAQLNILAWEKNQENIEALAIPGFGLSNNGLNIRVLWSLGYTF